MAAQSARKSMQYENLSQKFIITDKDMQGECFQRQYYHLYRARAKLLHRRIINNAKSLIGDDITPVRLPKAKRNEFSLVIGTFWKRVKLRPSVLRNLAEEEIILPEPVVEDRLVGDEDYLELEDDDQIVRLSGKINFDDVATGCIGGVYGIRMDNDVFEAERIIWPEKAPQPKLPTLDDDRYVMFISGLAFTGKGEEDAEKMLALDMMQKWLCGYLPLSQKESKIVERVVRLVIAGESIAITEKGKEFTIAARYLIKNEECPNIDCAAYMDKFLAKLSSLVEVDLMPGMGDPATHLMPQQPIHRAVFSRSSYHGKMLNLVTNPYQFSLGGFHIIGTSGESLSDLKRFSKEASGEKLLSNMLEWQHIAPTVPDTVDGFPFDDRDPFIIDSFPHILFAGNQGEAAHQIIKTEQGQKTLLLSVPSFTKTKSALLVNLRTFDTIEHIFATPVK